MTRSRFLTLAASLLAAPFAARAATPSPATAATCGAKMQPITLEYTLKPADGVKEEMERFIRETMREELAAQSRCDGFFRRPSHHSTT